MLDKGFQEKVVVHKICRRCNGKNIFTKRSDAEKALKHLREKTDYGGRVYRCPHKKGVFHIGRDYSHALRRRKKNDPWFGYRAFLDYRIYSNGLSEQLKNGSINQEQFDREHELLDERYGWLR